MALYLVSMQTPEMDLETIRAHCIAILERHAPEDVCKIDKVLKKKKYVGNEIQVLYMLQESYEPQLE